MARYRKIDPRIWNDEKFASLSHEGQRMFLFVLTHPSMTSLGAFRISREGMAAELGLDDKEFDKPFTELLRKGLVMYDERVFLIFAPNFLKYNAPENPNVVKGWGTALDFLPECPLLLDVLIRAKACASSTTGLSKAFDNTLGSVTETLSKRYPKPFQKGMAKQEQEQEQKQKQKINTNKQQTEVSEAIETPKNDSVCSVSSCEDNFSEDEVIDAPVKVQIEHAQLSALENIKDEKKPLTLVELITACKTFGIKLSRTPKTEAIANRKTVNLFVLRECVKAWKGTNTGTGYFIGILENASKDPNSILPHEKREKPELSAETITDKQAGYFASRLVKDVSFQSTFGVGHSSFDTFIAQVTQRLHDPEYFKEYTPWMQKLGFMSTKREAA